MNNLSLGVISRHNEHCSGGWYSIYNDHYSIDSYIHKIFIVIAIFNETQVLFYIMEYFIDLFSRLTRLWKSRQIILLLYVAWVNTQKRTVKISLITSTNYNGAFGIHTLYKYCFSRTAEMGIKWELWVLRWRDGVIPLPMMNTVQPMLDNEKQYIWKSRGKIKTCAI